jgi:cytochrome c-type biogenesis protein CcmE
MALSTRPTAVPSAPPVLRRRRRLLGTRRRQIVAAVVILGAIGFLVTEGLHNATSYFLYTNQAVAQRATLGTKPFRIEGTVEHDVRRVGQYTDFTITANNVAVPIVSTGSPTALFKPGIPVVLEGHWAATGPVYDSNLIMVKHTASYVEAHPDRLKSQLPKKGNK